MIEVKKWLSLALATLALYGGGPEGGVHGANAICVRGRTWWDRQRGACLPCTRCEPTDQLAVRTPCEVHRDTTCISIYDPDIWPFATSDNDTGPESDPGRRDYLVYDTGDGSVASDSVWDSRITALTLAASGCVIFFVVVLTLSLSHARQWRKLKQALRTDVEELSVKLKLMESGAAPAVAHHVYCNIPPRKDAFINPATATKKGFGNVYTQEKHPS